MTSFNRCLLLRAMGRLDRLLYLCVMARAGVAVDDPTVISVVAAGEVLTHRPDAHLVTE